MIIETVVERFAYRCGQCDADWTTDFEARHATGVSGGTRAFYFRHGLPCIAPHAAQPLCPHCGCGAVHVKSLGHPTWKAPAAGRAGKAEDAESMAGRIRRYLLDLGAEALASLGDDAVWQGGPHGVRIASGRILLYLDGRALEVGRDARLADVVVQGHQIIACLSVSAEPLDYQIFLTLTERNGRIIAARTSGDALDALAGVDHDTERMCAVDPGTLAA